MKQNETSITSITSNGFYCEKCDFKCSKKGDWGRHILTLKHQSETNLTKIDPEKDDTYKCLCGQILNSRSTIWRHKKKCMQHSSGLQQGLYSSSQSVDNEIVKMLIKDNSEMKTMMMEVVKSIQPVNNNHNHSHNNNNNTTNNHFNLQIYLNETCKDAVNLSDFVNSLQVKLKDLEETARLGYSEGISKIFINGLNELEVSKRPIHCSDAKRETLYVKDKNEWIKDTDKVKLTNAIRTIGKKNIQQISEWQKKYPEYNDPASRQNDKYLKMLCNAMNGSTDDEQEKNMEKILRNITKEVIIDKQLV